MSNSVALVVGGSNGMGRAIAQRLLEQGNTVIILSRRASTLDEAKKP